MNLGRAIRLLSMWLVLAATAALLSTQAHAQSQRVEVQLSTNRISVDESVILSVRAYGLDAEIDASALNKDFDVTRRSSSRQITIENGKRTSLVEWVLELMPKVIGTIEVPPVIVGSEQSRPLTLLVEKSAIGTDRDLYLEANVDVVSPFVQAQVIYTLRVFQDVRFLDASLQVPEVDGVLMQQLAEEKNYKETVNGREYVISEIRYAVFPQQSGSVIIPPVTLQAVVPVDQQQIPNTRTRTRRVTRRTNEVELDVRARPDGLAGSWWLPAKEVKLQSEWSTPISSLVIDQPVTRTIDFMATGVADTQLPELEVPVLENVSIYADSPTAATNNSERGLISQQTNTWAVIPQVAGELVLPEVRIDWFDTSTGEARVAVLPEETLIVAASATLPNNSALTQPNAGANTDGVANGTGSTLSENDSDALVETPESIDLSSAVGAGQGEADATDALGNVANVQAGQLGDRWRTIAIALLAGWVLSLLGLWLWWKAQSGAKRSKDRTLDDKGEADTQRFARRAGASAALQPIKEACESGDASKISKATLSWASMVWPGNSPTNLSDVAERLQSPALSQAFAAIDEQLYRPSGSVKTVATSTIPELIKGAVDQYQQVTPAAIQSNALPSL